MYFVRKISTGLINFLILITIVNKNLNFFFGTDDNSSNSQFITTYREHVTPIL